MGKTSAKTPQGGESLEQILMTQEKFLLPFDQLGNSGDLDRMISESGLSRSGYLSAQQLEESLGLTERFGSQMIREQSRLREEAIAADPIAKAARDASLKNIEQGSELSSQLFESAGSGLEDLDGDGLPDDIKRNILESSRSSLAARGLSESGAGGVLESLALIGGKEGLRSRRLSQAQSVLSGNAQSTSPGLAFSAPSQQGMISGMGMFPGSNQLAGLAGTSQGVLGQLLGQQNNFRFQEQQALGQTIGMMGGMGASALTGGIGGGMGSFLGGLPGF